MSSLELEYTLAGRPQLLVIINLFFFFPHSLCRLQCPSLSVWLSSSSYLYLVYVVKCRRRIQRQSAAARIPMSTQTTPYHRARCDTSSTPAAGIKSLPSPSYGFRSCAVQRIFTTPGVPISIGVTTTLP